MKNKLGRCHEDVFAVPDIEFSSDNPYGIADEVTHPLLKHTVPNDRNTDKSILITGSNASGKSTYLKTADSEICSVSAFFVVRVVRKK